MQAVAMIVTSQLAHDGDAERFEVALLAHRERCLRDEPGTLQFDVLRPYDSEGTFMIYEVYTDEEALRAPL